MKQISFLLKFSDHVTDKLLHRLARRIGTEQAHLAAELDLQHCEIQQLQSTHREHTTITFHALKVTRHTRACLPCCLVCVMYACVQNQQQELL